MPSLGVSIDRHEIHTADTGIYHAVNGRTAGTADANYFNTGKCFNCGFNFWHEFLTPIKTI
jgi:hypothetical protein